MKLNENQRVYIRGGKDKKQGKRVIEELERLGGVDKYKLRGTSNKQLYYIRPNGDIDCVYDCEGRLAEFVKEYYTEVKVNEWPDIGDIFYYVGPDMRWYISKNDGDPTCNDIIRSDNCFRTHEEALEVSNQFREIIKFHKQLKKQRNGKEKV